MTTQPAFPPVYEPIAHRGKDAFHAACRLAARMPRDGALLWSDRQDALDCALVLEPDRPASEALLVAYVAAVALGDALGALTPPVLPITFGWPDRIEANGGSVGGLRLRWAAPHRPDEAPRWLALGVALRIAADWSDDSPGRDVHRTTLQDEGCAELEARDLIEAFARHFLAWVNRWQDEGFAPVRQAWLHRAGAYRETEAAAPAAARILGIADDGALLIERAGVHQSLALAPALERPTWRL
jgi:BirA family biotin operon repressor/biotin-[acetyl-CoA-carboxylase] ligase